MAFNFATVSAYTSYETICFLEVIRYVRLRFLPQPKVSQYEENNDDGSDQPDDVVHEVPLLSICLSAVTKRPQSNKSPER